METERHERKKSDKVEMNFCLTLSLFFRSFCRKIFRFYDTWFVLCNCEKLGSLFKTADRSTTENSREEGKRGRRREEGNRTTPLTTMRIKRGDSRGYTKEKTDWDCDGVWTGSFLFFFSLLQGRNDFHHSQRHTISGTARIFREISPAPRLPRWRCGPSNTASTRSPVHQTSQCAG